MKNMLANHQFGRDNSKLHDLRKLNFNNQYQQQTQHKSRTLGTTECELV